MSKVNKIELYVKCKACKGTGVYVGMAERDGAGVICTVCDGTGCKHFEYEYELFSTREVRDDVSRVYKSGYDYVISPTVNINDVEFQHEGVSYEDFKMGKKPKHIELMVCPMLADQGACHKIPNFVDTCNKNNGKFINMIVDCEHQCKKSECWERFNSGTND